MILTRSTRLVQPQGPVQLDYSNPLLQGHSLLWSAAHDVRQSLIGQQRTATVNGGYAATTDGRSWTSKVAGQRPVYFPAGESFITTSDGTGTGDFTAWVVANPGASTAILMAQGNGTSTSGGGYIQIAVQPGQLLFRVGTDNKVGNFDQLNSSSGVINGSVKLFLVKRQGQELSIWVDGNKDASQLFAVRSILGSTNVTPLAIGASSHTTNTNTFDYLLAGAANRAMSDAEIASLSSNPWQLFKPVQRRIYFDMGAGGGGESATHDTSGAITSSPAELSGAAERTRQHDTSAELAGAGSVVSATAQRNVTLFSSGALAGGLAVVTASATHTAGPAEHATIGEVAASGALLSGSASRVPAPVTHETSGDLGGMGAFIDGQAQGPQSVSMRPGFEMSSRKVYIKRGKRIHIFDTVEDADEWLEAEQRSIEALSKAKPTPRKKSKVFKALDEAVPHDVVRLDVVRAMVDYLGIPVEMPTLEARQDWAEVARVALIARQLQDEEDIEMLLAA